MTFLELGELAYAAGAAGQSWMSWAAEDVVQDYVLEHDVDTDALEAKWRAGARSKWTTRWTTAPEGYDSFQSVTVETSEWKQGKTLRKVLIDPDYVNWHEARWGSGLYGSFREDPRIEEKRIAEAQERYRVERKQAAERYEAGLTWLASLTDADLAAMELDTLEEHGVGLSELRKERDKRHILAATAQRAELWSQCRAAFPDGAILVDEGAPAVRGTYGAIPGRDPHVYYNVSVQNDYHQNAEEALVVGEGHGRFGSLADIAHAIEAGSMRIAAPETVPPRKVTDRIGHERYKDILKVTVLDRTVWVGWPRFANDPLVLDEKGHKVRNKAVVDAAMEEWYLTHQNQIVTTYLTTL